MVLYGKVLEHSFEGPANASRSAGRHPILGLHPLRRSQARRPAQINPSGGSQPLL